MGRSPYKHTTKLLLRDLCLITIEIFVYILIYMNETSMRSHWISFVPIIVLDEFQYRESEYFKILIGLKLT